MRVTGARHEPTTAAGSFDYIAIGFYAPTGWKAGWDDRRMLPDWRADKETQPCSLPCGGSEGLGGQGYRALRVAVREVEATHSSAALADENELVFAGLAVFLDPPKASAGETIQALAAAGVGVKVLTGDNELVARHVFDQIGVPVTGVLTGSDLDRLSQEALLANLPQLNLFCRLAPQQKLRVLMALKRAGYVVGYMGDGINDAPALHAADVGISVDGAADVARDAADMILLEHDLSVVHRAVMHGRATVRNVAKYILMGASSNFGNMVSMAGAALFLPFLPMLPTQVLLNNLLYDTSQVAIPFDDVDPQDTERPVRWDTRLIERFMLVFGPLSSVFDFLTFYVLIGLFHAGEALFHTGWFIESLATQVLVVFAIRTRRPFFRSRPHRLLIGSAAAILTVGVLLPFSPFAPWLGFVTPPGPFFVYLILAIVAYLVFVEGAKHVLYGVCREPKVAPALAANPLRRRKLF
jgi:P-type Mg2+ transporter